MSAVQHRSVLRECGGPIAVVGATGAVGREALAILAERGVPRDRVVALASHRSAGTHIPYAGADLVVEETTLDRVRACPVALFCATSDVARALARHAAEAGTLVVDNSSAFRHEADVPLVIPEVNARLISPTTRLIANPNCSTIILLVALEPLRQRFGLRRVDVATYQAVSGAGAAGMDELLVATHAALRDTEHPPRVFREPCAFNVFSHNSSVDEQTGLNAEETKIIKESRRIWNDATIEVCPACARVPVLRAHVEAATVTLGREVSESELREALAGAPGVTLVDDRKANSFPTSRKASGQDNVLVGRLRLDPSSARNGRGERVCLFLSGDQLRKGAALNAVQIAELGLAIWK